MLRYGACPWAPVGLTREDLRQEALIGLLEACHAYDPRRGSFEKLASTCVYNCVHRAWRDATRVKHRVLSEALWREHHEDSDLGRSGDKQKPVTAARVAASESADPARIVELREELRERVAAQRWRAQLARGSGRRLYSPQQIAHALELVAQGRSTHEAGAAVGAAHTTVMRWVARPPDDAPGRGLPRARRPWPTCVPRRTTPSRPGTRGPNHARNCRS